MNTRVAWLVLVAGCAADPAPTAAERCSTSIATYCATNNCPMTWDAAQQPASWPCDTSPRISLATCADVSVATFAGIDAGIDFYYDASGQLYRVEHYQVGVGGSICLAGTGEAMACSDPNPVSVCSAP